MSYIPVVFNVNSELREFISFCAIPFYVAFDCCTVLTLSSKIPVCRIAISSKIPVCRIAMSSKMTVCRIAMSSKMTVCRIVNVYC